MGKDNKIKMFAGMGLLVVILTGCMGSGLIISSPPWHQLQSGLYDTVEGKVFYGIGRADGLQNLTLLRATADNRARKELTDVLGRYVEELARSAKARLDPAWATLSSEDQQQAMGMLVRSALRKSVVSEHWSDSQQPRVYSLCRLGLDGFKQALFDSRTMDERLRSAMQDEADKVYARLSKKM